MRSSIWRSSGPLGGASVYGAWHETPRCHLASLVTVGWLFRATLELRRFVGDFPRRGYPEGARGGGVFGLLPRRALARVPIGEVGMQRLER